MVIELLGSQVCHLCDDAKSVVYRVIETNPFNERCQLKIRDILLDDVLFEQYRYSIPVLRSSQIDQELGWPFDEADVKAWLSHIGKDRWSQK